MANTPHSTIDQEVSSSVSSVVNSYRTFIAIELPPDIRRRIKEHIDRLRSAFPDVRASWSREDNLHLTLKFLGDVLVTRIPALSDAAAKASGSIEPFELIVSGCGSFPPRAKPKVLWIGVLSKPFAVARDFDTSDLQHLHAAIENECAKAGFERDKRAFHPHLTIARLRKPTGSRRLSEDHKALNFPSQNFNVSEIVVFKSELLPEGSKHTALSYHRLGTK